MQKTPQ